MDSSLKFAHVFSSNMVLQQSVEITVWGEAAQGESVLLEFCGETRETIADGGKWQVVFPPVSAGGPYIMNAASAGEEIVLTNILVGEVWLGGGQSNMNFKLLYTRDGFEEIPAANYPDIRLYTVPKIVYGGSGSDTVDDELSQPGWQICSPEAVKLFSAVAYHFAKDLHKVLNVPVGIINCSWDGTSASCWMSEQRLLNCKDIRVYLDEYRDLIEHQDARCYERELSEYNDSVSDHLKWVESIPFDAAQMEVYFRAQEARRFPWPPPMGPKCELRPAGLYYTMLKKIIPFSIKGVIWYQGETDACKPHLYEKLFGEMIANWREDWHIPNMPFLFVQITSFGLHDLDDWALLREQQLFAARSIENVAMAVSIDCGDKSLVHPIDKKPVGDRLALLARAKVYGQDVECSGPVFSSLEITGRSIVLTFEHIGSGLMVKGDHLKGFEICGSDGVFAEAEAVVQARKVVLHSDFVSQPVAMRYGWGNYTEANLYNSYWLPASPFRTDVKSH